jgi:FkbM family methyltransferase
MKFSSKKLFRRVFLPLFARFNPGDITIRHHYTGQPIRLHSFHHKGYWFHGRKRESSSMQLFRKLVHRGDTVIEIGGHIGYISLYFKSLVGDGRVIVFEPGQNNLPYMRRNIENRGVELIEKAVGNFNGSANFYLDPLTGQNNSLIADFDRFSLNKAYAFVETGEVQQVEVAVLRLDDFVRDRGLKVNFIKIDVEGAEWDVLQGLTGLLTEAPPALMVELQVNREEILSFLGKQGYVLFNADLKAITGVADLRPNENVFALHSKSHSSYFQELKLAPSLGFKGWNLQT